MYTHLADAQTTTGEAVVVAVHISHRHRRM